MSERPPALDPKHNLKIRLSPPGSILFPTMETYASAAYARDTLYSAVLGRLLYLDAKGDLHAGLLESWAISKDSRAWKFRLRPGLKFHNGREVTAEDLEYSLIRYLLSPRATPGRTMRLHILGATEVKVGSPFVSGMVEGVKVLDGRTVQVRLATADPYFHLMLAQSRDAIVAEEAIAEDHFSWKTIPIGAGPYQVTWADPNGKYIQLAAFPGYATFSPGSARTIEISSEPNALSPDLVVGDFERPTAGNFVPEVISIPAFIRGIYFNFQSPLARDLDFRRSIALAVDRKDLLKDQPYASPTWEMVPSNLWGRLNQEDAPDLALSRGLMKQALARHGGGNTLTVPVPGLDLARSSNQWVTQLGAQLRAIGLNLEFDSKAPPVFRKEDETSPFFLLGYIPEIPDPFVVFRTFREGGPWIAKLSPADTIFPSLLDTDLGELSQKGREALLRRLGTHFKEQAFAVPLFEQKLVYWVNPARIKTLTPKMQRHTMLFEWIELQP